jgi:hypothetical protein
LETASCVWRLDIGCFFLLQGFVFTHSFGTLFFVGLGVELIFKEEEGGLRRSQLNNFSFLDFSSLLSFKILLDPEIETSHILYPLLRSCLHTRNKNALLVLLVLHLTAAPSTCDI